MDSGSHQESEKPEGKNSDTKVKNNIPPAGKVCATREEYFAGLEKWLQEAYMWQMLSSTLPYALLSSQMLSASSGGQVPLLYNTPVQGATVQGSDAFRTRRQPTQGSRNFQQRTQTVTEEGIEYRIPPLWKRFVAEFLDFLILFFLKLGVTFIAVDFFDFIDLEKYDLDVLQRNVKIDYKVAIEMTSEILILEMIHRIAVCIFETFWLQRGIGGHIGGATPGKTMMGIRVVLCDKVTTIEGRPMEVVVVHPGTDLGLAWAFARSFLKNLILAILFPICFALFFFRHNRTGYDILCRSIVVEDPPRQAH